LHIDIAADVDPTILIEAVRAKAEVFLFSILASNILSSSLPANIGVKELNINKNSIVYTPKKLSKLAHCREQTFEVNALRVN
jgi:hypothetical protein